MPALSTDLRNKLERTIIEARDVAEAGARAALEALAVHHHEPYPHQKKDEAQKKLRNQLRAHARQLGDVQNPRGELKIEHLVHECAYEHWHRMLFARFLAENDLLIEPTSGVPISLAECEDLAKEAKVDLWTYASRCAQKMLPRIFRPDDPLLQVGLANEHRVRMERLLAGLETATFKADDALGWVYQFWQSKKKDQVNQSGEKITSDTLPAVTQLFTEHYMVLFLLHNTIGAWHAGKFLAANPNIANTAPNEDALRQSIALTASGGYSFDYLRFVRGSGNSAWRPASGTFDGWPKVAAMLKLLDPCCGSGHFLVAAFELLVRLRMAEEGMDVQHAVDAVLADNLFGLELDGRCTQIAAFNIALAAWKLAGFRHLPPVHVACTGIGPQASEEQWLKLVEQSRIPMPALGRGPITNGLKNLHHLFSQAPTLGSLIDPSALPADLISADYETLQPYLSAALVAETSDDDVHERAVAAQGMVKAAELLAGEYQLVVTNVPYLGRGDHGEVLASYAEQNYRDAKSDLANMFVDRSLAWCAKSGTVALVTPWNWLFLTTAKHLRARLLDNNSFRVVARVGEGGFRSPKAAGAFPALTIISRESPSADESVMGIDVSAKRTADEKADELRVGAMRYRQQRELRSNPDSIISFDVVDEARLLSHYAYCYQGTSTGDTPRLVLKFWEIPVVADGWLLYQVPPAETLEYGGREHIVRWPVIDAGFEGCAVRGNEAWGRRGVAIGQMRTLPATLYTGERFSNSTPVLVPHREEYLPALWAFCRSPSFCEALRALNPKLSVDNGYVAKIAWDYAHWQAAATPVPEPSSVDPTQWLFHGRSEPSSAPLQVAVARLLGYRWPAELDEKMRLSEAARELLAGAESLLKYADDDGIVCIPSVRGEEPAADRLLALLAASGIKPDRNLDDWLRNDFFEEHCELFMQRPFVWHIWDGRKRDGFHALVNYHKLVAPKAGSKLLENLTYSYLGEWINRQQDGVKRGEDGAEERLVAATELQKRLAAILKGEPPFDVFVRWKPLREQPIGWEPDITDGVRINIRPFLASGLPGGRSGAGVLRVRPGNSVNWNKDRGKEPARKKNDYPWLWGWDERSVDFMGGDEFDGNRWNDCHYSLATKRKAREDRGDGT